MEVSEAYRPVGSQRFRHLAQVAVNDLVTSGVAGEMGEWRRQKKDGQTTQQSLRHTNAASKRLADTVKAAHK